MHAEDDGAYLGSSGLDVTEDETALLTSGITILMRKSSLMLNNNMKRKA